MNGTQRPPQVGGQINLAPLLSFTPVNTLTLQEREKKKVCAFEKMRLLLCYFYGDRITPITFSQKSCLQEIGICGVKPR